MSEQLYVNGRIAVMSNRLLTADKFLRLAECNGMPEALKVLAECGYGAGITLNSPNDYEQILIAELDEAMSVFDELCFDKNAKAYFLCRYCYHNAKVLMKNKYMRQESAEGCFNNAGADPHKLQEEFVNDDYSSCSKTLAEALRDVDYQFADGNRSPRVVDVVLDKAMYREMRTYAKRSTNAIPRELFRYEADTLNLMLLYRLKKAAAEPSSLKDWFVEGGSLKMETLAKLWANDSAGAELAEPYRQFYSLCTTDNQNLLAAEAAQKAGRNKIVRDHADFLSVQPVIQYFFSKVDEIDKVRHLLIYLKNGVDKETIKNYLK